MDFSVVEKIHIRKDKCEKIGAFLYDREKDALYHESPWRFPVQIGISDGLKKCQLTPMFLRLPFIMKGWINSDILLRQIDLLKLALTGRILMHASCVVEKGVTTLIVGFPNSGKTFETYKAVSRGAELISEEYTVIENGIASPYKIFMRTCFSANTLKACGMKMTLYEKLWMAAATLRAWLFPFMYEAVIWRNIPASGRTSKIDKIVYGSTGREVKNWKEFAILCENEFPFMSSEFLQAYAVASGLDILGIQNKQREMIRHFVGSIYKNEK